MTEILAEKNNQIYLLISKDGEILVAKQIVKKPFIYYEDVVYHDVTKRDFHLILRQGGSKGYKLVKDITHEKLPLFIE